MKGYNVNKGFSLIELIVVIAILAVFTIMLAPKLLFYTERSRAEKDNSTISATALQMLIEQSNFDVFPIIGPSNVEQLKSTLNIK